MECSLRFAALLVRYLHLDLNHGLWLYFSRGSQNKEQKKPINKNKVLYERKFNFQLDTNNHKLEILIIISILFSLMKAKRI